MKDTIDRVKKCLGEVLALDPSEISDNARLMNDLGAESLDLVELMFLLEQEFEIELSKKDMSLAAQLGLTEEETHRDEVLTEKALAMLRERYPQAGDLLVDGVVRAQLAALVTVREVAVSVARKRTQE